MHKSNINRKIVTPVVTLILVIIACEILFNNPILMHYLQDEQTPHIIISAILQYISFIEYPILIMTIFITIKQLRDSKEIARATFLIELNKSYVENNDYIEIYNILQKCEDNKCPLISACDCKKNVRYR